MPKAIKHANYRRLSLFDEAKSSWTSYFWRIGRQCLSLAIGRSSKCPRALISARPPRRPLVAALNEQIIRQITFHKLRYSGCLSIVANVGNKKTEKLGSRPTEKKSSEDICQDRCLDPTSCAVIGCCFNLNELRRLHLLFSCIKRRLR